MSAKGSRRVKNRRGYDIDTSPMKPVTTRDLGKNLLKGADGKYRPHMGNKERYKAGRERAKRTMAQGLPISELDAVNFKLKLDLMRRGYSKPHSGDYYYKAENDSAQQVEDSHTN